MNRKTDGGLRILFSRTASLFRRRRLDAELEEEVRSHIELAVEENIALGMTEREARRAAFVRFGGVSQAQEAYRRQRGLPFLDVLARDLGYTFRQLWRSPGFTVTCILTLAIGIGINTAIFSLMDAVVVRPIAVPDLDHVVIVAERQGAAGQNSQNGAGDDKQVALANYQSWKQQSQSFENLAVRTYSSLSLTGAGDAARVDAEYTSANFFDVLRTKPLLGRVYNDSECLIGHDDVAVLSFGFWTKHFAADPAIVGRHVQLNERSYTIIGVMPRTAQYPSVGEIFLPFAPTQAQLQDRVKHDYLVLGRLKPSASLQQAQADLTLISSRLATQFPATNMGWSVRTDSLLHAINGDMTPMYFRLILVATAFVLLVVCANIANLQFVRGISRSPEIAVRTALGAGRGRLMRLLLTENILLGLLGAAGGLIIARICLRLCIVAMPEAVARYVAGWSNISLNGRALLFSLGLAVGAGLISGILPASRALRINLVDQLKAGSRSASGSRQTHRLRDIFAIAQIALSVLLVIGASLMCKGMWSMLHLADQFHPREVLTFTVYLPPARYGTEASMAAWYRDSLDRLRSLPGVKHAELTTTLPEGQDGWMQDFQIENRPLQPNRFQSAQPVTVSSGYFDAMHVPLFSGRSFEGNPAPEAQREAVVSRRFAEKFFPGEDPIGHRIQMGASNTGASNSEPAKWLRIVGVVGDVNYLWIDRSTEPAVYRNAAQMPTTEATYLVIGDTKADSKSDADPLALVPAVRGALAGLDPTVPLDAIQTFQRSLQQSLAGLTYVAAWLTVDAAVGLLLAAIGIFGVMANIVAERGREIGLRIALGATPRAMLGMILRRAVLLTAIGIGIGLPLAAAMAKLSDSLLFGVDPFDPVVFITITASVAVIGLLVSWGPARRAASIDPMRALRAE